MFSLIFLSFFYFFISLTLISATMVILSTNPVYSALFLVLVFFNSSLVILLLNLEFLALIFILIYIGAIMVLMLFVIMMLDIKQSIIYLNVYYYFFLSGFFLIFLCINLIHAINVDFFFEKEYTNTLYINWYNLLLEKSNSQVLGLYLYTYFSFFFLLGGLVLLIAMIGAISLTLEGYLPFNKRQFSFIQVSRNPKNSLFYVK